MQRQPEDTTADQGRESRWRSLFWCVALLATGALLWWIGGSMPPLAWREVAQVLRDIATTRPLFPLLLAQGALLLAAWGVLLLLAVRVIARFFQPWSAPVSQHPRRKQEMQAQTVRPEAVNAQERPSTHTRPEALSVPLMTEVTREAALNPTHEAPELALLGQLDEEDFTDPFPAWSNPSAIFGQALQVTVASLSDEGMQLVPATKAYLLTEKSGKDDTHPSLSFNFIALADHLSAEEQGYTASCRAIETMKDLVMRACMVMHNASEEALAALLAEQVQKVIRIIGEQRSGEETHPAMVAALIIGSTMIVEKIGDMRIYLCHAKEGFSQLSQTLPVVRPLETDTAIPSRSQAQQVRRKKRDRGSGSPLTFEQDRKAVSLLAGDRILLCSDGVWTVLHASYLEHILRFSGPDLADVRAALLQATRKSGSTDPVSIMVVQCQ